MMRGTRRTVTVSEVDGYAMPCGTFAAAARIGLRPARTAAAAAAAAAGEVETERVVTRGRAGRALPASRRRRGPRLKVPARTQDRPDETSARPRSPQHSTAHCSH